MLDVTYTSLSLTDWTVACMNWTGISRRLGFSFREREKKKKVWKLSSLANTLVLPSYFSFLIGFANSSFPSSAKRPTVNCQLSCNPSNWNTTHVNCYPDADFNGSTSTTKRKDRTLNLKASVAACCIGFVQSFGKVICEQKLFFQ